MKIPESPDIHVEEIRHPADLLAARRFQAEVYLESGYIDHLGPDGVVDDEWVAHSRYLVALRDPDRRIVGTCRHIFNSPASLPILAEFELDPEWRRRLTGAALDHCYEVSSFAVRGEGLQHTLVSAMFHREAVRFTMSNPTTVHVLAAVDHRFLRILQRWLNFPFRPIGPVVDYMGSPTVPVYGYMPELINAVLASDHDEMAYLLDGRTVDEVNDLVIDLREGAPDLASSTIPL